jgi:hypothetical protein
MDVSIRICERLDTDADLLMERIRLSRRILLAPPPLSASLGAPVEPAALHVVRFGGPALSEGIESHNRRGDSWPLCRRSVSPTFSRGRRTFTIVLCMISE